MIATYDQNEIASHQPQGMMLHCGGELVSRREVNALAAPAATETWHPLAYGEILNRVEDQLLGSGFRITETPAHALSHNGNRYFGVYNVGLRSASDEEKDDYSWVLGVRQSYDKTFPVTMVAGSRVFVCDNLAFSGEIKFTRKNTKNVKDSVRSLIARSIGQLHDKFADLDTRIEAYKNTDLTDDQAAGLIIRSVETKALPGSKIMEVADEWKSPSHEDFEPRTAWSLFNAFTEVYKSVKDPATLSRRSEALHGVIDGHCGVALAN